MADYVIFLIPLKPLTLVSSEKMDRLIRFSVDHQIKKNGGDVICLGK